MKLLAADEPAAFSIERPDGQSPYLIVCDHAGARIPRRLLNLGVSGEDMRRHIAWDIGAAALATKLAAVLDAWTILQTYSRLVIDCNRRPGIPESIVRVSETTRIAGNESVTIEEAAMREREIFRPYHERIVAELDGRQARQHPTLLIAIHSFTPRFHGKQRQWHAGVLYNRDKRLATRVLRALRSERGLIVGDNEPYAVSESTDYTLLRHGEARGLPYVGVELRQDLISTEQGRNEWSDRLAALLRSIAVV